MAQRYNIDMQPIARQEPRPSTHPASPDYRPTYTYSSNPDEQAFNEAEEEKKRKKAFYANLQAQGIGGPGTPPSSPRPGPIEDHNENWLGAYPPKEEAARGMANEPNLGGLGAGAGALAGMSSQDLSPLKGPRADFLTGNQALEDIGSAFSKKFAPIAGFFTGKKKGGLFQN